MECIFTQNTIEYLFHSFDFCNGLRSYVNLKEDNYKTNLFFESMYVNRNHHYKLIEQVEFVWEKEIMMVCMYSKDGIGISVGRKTIAE